MKKQLISILILVIIAGFGVAGYVFWASKQAPTDVFVATPQTETNTTPETQEQPTNEPVEGATTYNVKESSTFEWKATKAGGGHNGEINIIDGFISVANEKIIGGEFTIDMNSIRVLDINDQDFEEKIKKEFFQADQFATAKFVIKQSEFDGVKHTISGDLTIRDVTKPIAFPATITFANDEVRAVATFAINRQDRGLTTWNNVVNNFLEFDIDLTWTKAL